jgi:hypothetical protein
MFKMVFGNRAALARIIIWKAGGNQNHLPHLRISSLLGSQNHYCHLRRPFLIRRQFIDLPVADKSKQNTPHFTGEVITGILRSSSGYKQMFCALLGGAGLRVGGAMELEIDKHISKNFRTLYIRQKVRRGKLEHFLKTDAGRRDVDLCPALKTMLKTYVGERTSGFLFHNRKANFLSQTRLLRRGLHPALEKLVSQSRVSCVPSLPSYVAQKESRLCRLGKILDGT